MVDLSTAVASASAALELLKTALKARDQALTDKAIADMVDQLRSVNMAALEASQEALTGVKESANRGAGSESARAAGEGR